MSSSFNQSTSSGSTFPIQTGENNIMDQIAQTASGMAQQLYNWAGQTFAQTSAITNQAVGNFFNVSSNMLGLSQNLTNQYNNLFAPENAQLVADANSYASPARMAVDMGMAGATQAQAGTNALANSEEALRSFGIDPSAGRYAALDQASRVQNAANVAGAENAQRVSDIATGQKLRSDAVQVGAQLPAAISNVNNTVTQANTGASNAELANANTGANLYGLADKYLGTGMQLKLPFSGSTQSSQSSGSSNKEQNPSNGGNGSNGGAGNNGGGGNSGTSWSGMTPNTSAMGNGGGGGGGRGQPGSEIIHRDPGPDQPPGPGPDPGPGPGPDPGAGEGEVPWWTETGGQEGAINQWDGSQPNNPGSWDPAQSDPTAGAGGIPGDWQDPTPPPSDPSVWGGDPNAPPVDTSGGDQSTPVDTSGGDQSAPVDTSGGDQSSVDTSSGDTSGMAGDSGSSMDYSDFARGGNVPMRRLSNRYMAPSYAGGGQIPAGGHQVPASMSPSRGARVDDVQARGPGNAPMHLNANEFVIPQDVALWKGQEFFQKLINQSRMARHGAPAKPTQGQAR